MFFYFLFFLFSSHIGFTPISLKPLAPHLPQHGTARSAPPPPTPHPTPPRRHISRYISARSVIPPLFCSPSSSEAGLPSWSVRSVRFGSFRVSFSFCSFPITSGCSCGEGSRAPSIASAAERGSCCARSCCCEPRRLAPPYISHGEGGEAFLTYSRHMCIHTCAHTTVRKLKRSAQG